MLSFFQIYLLNGHLGDQFGHRYSTSTRSANAALMSHLEFQLAFIACLIIALKCRLRMQADSDFVSDIICHAKQSQCKYNKGQRILYNEMHCLSIMITTFCIATQVSTYQ